ncbi:allophanate hydrolase, partial [Thermoactinomyces vulgaris]
ALYRALEESPPPGVEDLVPAARTVLLRLAPGADPVRVEQAVRGLEPGEARAGTGELVRIPVVYDGEDLPGVAELTGLPVREVVRLHISPIWTVAFGGFAPGFGYL